MPVGEVRLGVRGRVARLLVVEVLADVQPCARVARLAVGPFVAGPAEVHRLSAWTTGHDQAVDLLPRAPPHVADPEIPSARSLSEAEGVA